MLFVEPMNVGVVLYKENTCRFFFSIAVRMSIQMCYLDRRMNKQPKRSMDKKREKNAKKLFVIFIAVLL